MIIGHCFIRKIRQRTYLMCETACSGKSTSPWTTPELLFEVNPGDSPDTWVKRARDSLAKAHPDHEIGDTAVSKCTTGAQVFDITLKMPPKKKGTISKLKDLL